MLHPSEILNQHIHATFHMRKHSLSMCYKICKNLENSILDEILKDNEMPEFKTYANTINKSGLEIDEFSVYDAIVILIGALEGRPLSNDKTMSRLKILPKTIITRKSNQDARSKEKEDNGLLGIQIPKIIDPNKKVKKVVRSVWTVKK